MFDRDGRVLCEHCMGSMKMLRVNADEAVFWCEGEECRRLVVYAFHRRVPSLTVVRTVVPAPA